MFQRRIIIVLSMMTMLVAFSVQTIMAADEPFPELKLEEITVTAYEELFLMELPGMMQSLRLDGKVFLAVHTVILPQWTEEIRRFELDAKAKDVMLIAPDSTEIPMLGYFDQVGQFEISSLDRSISRRSNWQDEPQQVYYNAVFAIPEDGQKYQLKLGPLFVDVEKPAEIEQLPEHGSMVNVEILGSRLVDQVKSIYEVGEEKIETTVSNPNGPILEVQIQVTPLRSNSFPGGFFWRRSWFWVLCDNGSYIQTVAEDVAGKLSDNVGHSLSPLDDETWMSGEVTLYFPVPKDTKSFTLIYITSPVAEGTLE
jgi:hypothetical protein